MHSKIVSYSIVMIGLFGKHLCDTSTAIDYTITAKTSIIFNYTHIQPEMFLRRIFECEPIEDKIPARWITNMYVYFNSNLVKQVNMNDSNIWILYDSYGVV